VVWTSHTDTETPFQLREKERKHERERVPIRALYKGDANAQTATAVSCKTDEAEVDKLYEDPQSMLPMEMHLKYEPSVFALICPLLSSGYQLIYCLLTERRQRT
jgi:hypothetical protein